jgi:hypothetical protein
MLHVVNLNMMAASTRHYPDGSSQAAAEAHRRDHIRRLRQALRARWAARSARLWASVRPSPGRPSSGRKAPACAVDKGYDVVNCGF